MEAGSGTTDWRTAELARDEVLEVLPVVQLAWPGTNRQSWQRYVAFVRARSRGGSAGVLALRDPANYSSGAIVYETERDLAEGAIFTVHLFTAVDLARSRSPVAALHEAALTKARDLGCVSMQIRLYHGQMALGAALRGLGFSDRAGYLWKRLPD
jgi:hypothetical protein